MMRVTRVAHLPLPPTVRSVAASGWRYHRHGTPERVLHYERYRVPFDRTSRDVVVKMLAAPVHRHDRNAIAGHYDELWRELAQCTPLDAYKTASEHDGRNGSSSSSSSHSSVTADESSSNSNNNNSSNSSSNSSSSDAALRFPRVAGVEGVGVVEEVGAAATVALRVGDVVWVNNPSVGCWATHIVTDADNLDVVPNRIDVDVEYLASLSVFHTAYHLTNSFVQLQPNDVVLQTGATSAVAQVCQGYVRARGARLFQMLRLGRSEHTPLVALAKQRGAFAVVPYTYARTNYMRRLLSDVPPPRLLLNHVCGAHLSTLVRLLGDDGVCVTYGNTSHRPIQLSNMEFIGRNVQLRGFCLSRWLRTHSRDARMRVHQRVIEGMTVAQGRAVFRAQRYKMDGDAAFAFCNAWDAPLSSRKSVLRMVGEYGEWRRPPEVMLGHTVAHAIWHDLMQELTEEMATTDNPQSMKYYTPFGDVNKVLLDPRDAKELGLRDAFLQRPVMPRHNASEQQQEQQPQT